MASKSSASCGRIWLVSVASLLGASVVPGVCGEVAVAGMSDCSCCSKMSGLATGKSSGLAPASLGWGTDAQLFLLEEPQPGDCSQPLRALPKAESRSSSPGQYHKRKPQLLRVSGQGRRADPSSVP